MSRIKTERVTLMLRVEKILKEERKALGIKEIANLLWKKERKFCLEKMKRSNKKTKEVLISQFCHEIYSHMYKGECERYNISVNSEYPVRLHYSPYSNKKYNVNKKDFMKDDFGEKDLYDKLKRYLASKNINAERIRESSRTTYKNKGLKKQWFFADVFGYKSRRTEDKIMKYNFENVFELYSYEVKLEITGSDIREKFFQTVANSSWANYSYIVTETIPDDRVLDELVTLCESYRIGFILLNKNQPKRSKVVVEAKRTNIDWKMLSKIYNENKDVQKFIDDLTGEFKAYIVK